MPILMNLWRRAPVISAPFCPRIRHGRNALPSACFCPHPACSPFCAILSLTHAGLTTGARRHLAHQPEPYTGRFRCARHPTRTLYSPIARPVCLLALPPVPCLLSLSPSRREASDPAQTAVNSLAVYPSFVCVHSITSHLLSLLSAQALF